MYQYTLTPCNELFDHVNNPGLSFKAPSSWWSQLAVSTHHDPATIRNNNATNGAQNDPPDKRASAILPGKRKPFIRVPVSRQISPYFTQRVPFKVQVPAEKPIRGRWTVAGWTPPTIFLSIIPLSGRNLRVSL